MTQRHRMKDTRPMAKISARRAPRPPRGHPAPGAGACGPIGAEFGAPPSPAGPPPPRAHARALDHFRQEDFLVGHMLPTVHDLARSPRHSVFSRLMHGSASG